MLNNWVYICVAARIYRYNCLAVTYVNFRQNSELFFIISKVLKFKNHNVSFLDGFIQLEISTNLCDIPGRSWNVHDPVIRHINNYSCRKFISSHSSLRTSSKKIDANQSHRSLWTPNVKPKLSPTMVKQPAFPWPHNIWWCNETNNRITHFQCVSNFFLTVMISVRPGY